MIYCGESDDLASNRVSHKHKQEFYSHISQCLKETYKECGVNMYNVIMSRESGTRL